MAVANQREMNPVTPKHTGRDVTHAKATCGETIVYVLVIVVLD